jgi:hypothetical protein
MDISIRLDRYSPPAGALRSPYAGEARFVGWLELLNVLEAELEKLASAGTDPTAQPEERRNRGSTP